MVRSEQRLALPELPVEDFVAAVDALVAVDQRWVPDAEGEKSLYIRPFMIATEKFLGVRPAAARDVHGDRQPRRRLLQGRRQAGHPVAHHRVHPRRPRRHGRRRRPAATTPARWSRSRRPPATAATRWSSSTPRRKYVEELGGMNMYFVFDDGRIVTPALGGTILEGITRASIIELAGKLGHQVEERKFSIDEWRDGVASGRITEVFACGTAAVVTPVGTLKWDGGEAPRRRRRRPGDHADAPRARRHPVRPRRGHVRVDAPGRLTRRAGRLPALVGAGALVLAGCSTPDAQPGADPAPAAARPRRPTPAPTGTPPSRPRPPPARGAGAAARRRRAGVPRRAPARAAWADDVDGARRLLRGVPTRTPRTPPSRAPT